MAVRMPCTTSRMKICDEPDANDGSKFRAVSGMISGKRTATMPPEEHTGKFP